ncbi:MAG: phosphatase PAP2 family protein, partial [Nitrosarchaeum sp.]|nr:phosphatase PAP2 family protein [Nitrosarchaeum sp.]
MKNWIFDIRSRSFVLLTAAFILVSMLVLFQVTASFDQFVVSSIANSPENFLLDNIMQIITETGDSFYMLGFGILMLIIKKTRRIGITIMILIVLSTLLTGYIKCGIDRERPSYDYEGTPFPVEISKDTFALFCEGGYNASYPSGHAARSTIFGIVLGYVLYHRFPRGAY